MEGIDQEKKKDIVKLAQKLVKRYKKMKTIAFKLMDFLDGKYGTGWRVICMKGNWAASVNPSPANYTYVSYFRLTDDVAEYVFLVYKMD